MNNLYAKTREFAFNGVLMRDSRFLHNTAPDGGFVQIGGVSARWVVVGNIMRDCRRPDVPCHRVSAACGRLGGYGGNEGLKRALLAAEGLVVSGSRVRELERVRFKRLPRHSRIT